MLLREIGEERLQIHTLLPAGVSPHTFEARPGDLRFVADADWILRVGGRFDAWAETLLRVGGRAPRETVLLALPGLEPIAIDDHRADRHALPAWDPHCWLDPVRVREVIVPALVATLVALDPDGASLYRARARHFADTLDELDAELRALLVVSERAPAAFISLHPAWAYFAERYGLQQVGVVEHIPGEAPSPRHLVELVRASRAQGARQLLIEPQLPALAAQVLAEETHTELRLVDPLGDPAIPERARYGALLRFNAHAVASAGGSYE